MTNPSSFLLLAGLFASAGLAQQVRIAAPIGAIGPGPGELAVEETGVTVQMFENPNLDRYLRRAQIFLDREEYDAAITVLQDVIEGKTVEFFTSGADPDVAAGDGGTGEPATDEAGPGAGDGRSTSELDAANSVFSQNERLYRPVRRLCHELLAQMPAHGVGLYRTLYEVAAKERYEAALASGSVAELEQVVNRFFVTIPAGQAMVVLADRFLHEGRYRAAVQVLRDLIEIYPPNNLKQAGADVVWCKFKIALCLRMAGEPAVAQEAVQALARDHPEDSLRILGELQTVKDFPEMRIFAADVVALSAGLRAESGPTWLSDQIEDLVPLWQYRFVDPDPYRNPKSAKDNSSSFRFGGGRQLVVMPHANRYGPASWIRFVAGEREADPPRALFLDHYRLRVADARTGLLMRAGDGVEVPARPREGHPRIRIAASDFGLMRPVEDEARRYIVIGHDKATSKNDNVLEASELVAYDRLTMARVWSSDEWLDGDDGLRDVTFLAAPAVFGERVLLPALRKGAYALECLDRNSGRPLWHAKLHAAGSEFFKAPGTPVRVVGGTAYVLTNAGCLAAVDAFAGDLRWIRRYEREDPMRPKLKPHNRSEQQQRYGLAFEQGKIEGFLPNDLIVSNGLVILAPCDGAVLLCLDGATGEPVWMLDGQTRFAPYGKLESLVGATANDVFATSAEALVCIGLRGGLVKWSRDLPSISGPRNVGRGRGVIVGDTVLIPGEREILAFDTAGKKPMRRLRLAPFGIGPEPLPGPFNITSSGPWLGLGYQGGIEVFSTRRALREVAAGLEDAWSRAGYLVAAGDKEKAEKVLHDWIASPEMDPADRRRACKQLLSLVRERGMALAANDHLTEALSALESIADTCVDRDVRLGWHLARVEVCKEASDLLAHEQEQQRLYDFMEGKKR